MSSTHSGAVDAHTPSRPTSIARTYGARAKPSTPSSGAIPAKPLTMSKTVPVPGFAGIAPDDGVEGFARAPYVLAIDVGLDGVWASTAPEWVELIDQQYRFEAGELLTRWRFRSGGATAVVETTAFCPRSVPGLAAIDVRVTVDGPRRPAAVGGRGPDRRTGDRRRPCPTAGSGTERGRRRTTPLALRREPGDAGRRLHDRDRRRRGCGTSTSTRDDRGRFSTTYRLRARRGRRYRLTMLSAVVPDLSHVRPDEQAGRLAALGRGADARSPAGRQPGSLGRAVEGTDHDRRRRPALAGDHRCESPYLLSSTHSASLASTSLFGLAYWPTYHYYHGHVMWDIETFTVPPLLLLAPDAAHALLDYRSRHLGAAHHNAALHGWRGAMYPWESCPSTGKSRRPAPGRTRKTT